MVSTTYQAVEQSTYMVDLCPLMRSWSPMCLPCSTLDMTAIVLSNAIGFPYAGFFRGLLAPDVDTYIGDLLQRIVTLSRVAKLGLSSQLWPNLTTGQL